MVQNVSMRIDKFLWCVRYFKTRSIATDEVKKNRVWINDEVAKPSKEVLVGDIVKVRKTKLFILLRCYKFRKAVWELSW
ncbi:RNA-binding S4 domain-containing protein [Ornithobacterium rhinotracheale]|uniref:RNA-binding S4 domain-containing protein n=1 Tax=Ornithobacterium rhinotracheale TaxID=28251 RepID=UPI00374CE411